MKQLSFSDAEYGGKRKRTRREVFLAEMHRAVPWARLEALIEPHYPKAGGGRRPYPLATMLRIHCLQQWYGLSDPAMEEELYEIARLPGDQAPVRLRKGSLPRAGEEHRPAAHAVCAGEYLDGAPTAARYRIGGPEERPRLRERRRVTATTGLQGPLVMSPNKMSRVREQGSGDAVMRDLVRPSLGERDETEIHYADLAVGTACEEHPPEDRGGAPRA
jgi:hypothetical protein